MSPNPISDFNLQEDYGDLIKSRASRYNPEVIREVIQRSIDLHRNDPEADDGDIIKSGEDPYDPKVSELMIQRCVDIISDVEGDDCVRPDPSKPLPEGYTMASFAYCGRENGVPVPIGPPVTAVLMDCIVCGQGGLHWPLDCPLKGTEEYYRKLGISLRFAPILNQSCMDEPTCVLDFLAFHGFIPLDIGNLILV